MEKQTLLQPLADLDFLRIIHLFQWSTTNQLMAYTGYNRKSILRRIHKLEPDLHIIQDSSRYLYGLNQNGCTRLGMSSVDTSEPSHIYDVVFRNEIWAWFRYPKWHWQTEIFPSRKREPLVPDAYWYQGAHLYIVEIDTGHNMQETLSRMRRYRGFIRWAERHGKPAPLVYYFTPDRTRAVWLEEMLGDTCTWLQCVHHIKKGG